MIDYADQPVDLAMLGPDEVLTADFESGEFYWYRSLRVMKYLFGKSMLYCPSCRRETTTSPWGDRGSICGRCYVEDDALVIMRKRFVQPGFRAFVGNLFLFFTRGLSQ